MSLITNVAAVVPVFNPEPQLKDLCDSLLATYKIVVVVDDGSSENVEDFSLLSDKIILLRHDVNRGKGRAIKTAIGWLKDKAPEIQTAVFVDGDGQHCPTDVAKVVERSRETGNAVLGVRNFKEAGIPFRSRLGNIVTAFLVRLMYRIPIYDTQTGLRAIPRRLFDMMLNTAGERYEFEMRLFGQLASLNEKLEQVSIETIYIESNRASHFRPIRDTVKIYRGLFADRFLKFSLSSAVAFLVDNGVFLGLLLILDSFWLTRSICILIAIVVARLLSATVNFCCNKYFVFESSAKSSISVGKYAILAAGIMGCSYVCTDLLSTLFDSEALITTMLKIVVDLTLFLLSYEFQKRWVFKKNKILHS